MNKQSSVDVNYVLPEWTEKMSTMLLFPLSSSETSERLSWIIFSSLYGAVSTGTHSSGLSVLPLINKRVSEVEKSL